MNSNKRINKVECFQEEKAILSGNKKQKINNGEYAKRYREKKKQELIKAQKKTQELITEITSLRERILNLEKENERMSRENLSLCEKIQNLEKDALDLNWTTKICEEINNSTFNKVFAIPLFLTQNQSTSFISPSQGINISSSNQDAFNTINETINNTIDENNSSFYNFTYLRN
ncbi:13295_t:CDS:2 [Ambispora leptoticha]|uniref:13295_t:CDS:1 n=1 Tax=Ambispora leptoticha TaxID=144679 RepID=A0A9N8ZNJ0_9GLOM|nr:13295_t:CDS:2 [Ambispora leptoticha]